MKDEIQNARLHSVYLDENGMGYIEYQQFQTAESTARKPPLEEFLDEMQKRIDKLRENDNGS